MRDRTTWRYIVLLRKKGLEDAVPAWLQWIGRKPGGHGVKCRRMFDEKDATGYTRAELMRARILWLEVDMEEVEIRKVKKYPWE